MKLSSLLILSFSLNVYSENPRAQNTYVVSHTWAEEVDGIPNSFQTTLENELEERIKGITVDPDAGRAVLCEIAMNIRSALQSLPIGSTMRGNLQQYLDVINTKLQGTNAQIAAIGTALAQDSARAAAKVLVGNITNLAGAVTPTASVVGTYTWCEGDFDGGSWNLDRTTQFSGTNSPTISGGVTGKLSTFVGIALDASAEAEVPAQVVVSGLGGVTLNGQTVRSVVDQGATISFIPTYNITLNPSLSFQSGWGIQVQGGLSFNYTLPVASNGPGASDVISFARQSFTATEDDPTKETVAPAGN